MVSVEWWWIVGTTLSGLVAVEGRGGIVGQWGNGGNCFARLWVQGYQFVCELPFRDGGHCFLPQRLGCF